MTDIRRYRDVRDETGHVTREYAPPAPDGEAEGYGGDPWPFKGTHYCNTFADTPWSRWYKLETFWDTERMTCLAWQRCDPPKGYVGAPATEEQLEAEPLPAFLEDDDVDTDPDVTV